MPAAVKTLLDVRAGRLSSPREKRTKDSKRHTFFLKVGECACRGVYEELFFFRELLFFLLFYIKTCVGILFPSAYLRLWRVGCASYPADPLPFEPSQAASSYTPVRFPNRAKLGSFKLL